MNFSGGKILESTGPTGEKKVQGIRRAVSKRYFNLSEDQQILMELGKKIGLVSSASMIVDLQARLNRDPSSIKERLKKLSNLPPDQMKLITVFGSSTDTTWKSHPLITYDPQYPNIKDYYVHFTKKQSLTIWSISTRDPSNAHVDRHLMKPETTNHEEQMNDYLCNFEPDSVKKSSKREKGSNGRQQPSKVDQELPAGLLAERMPVFQENSDRYHQTLALPLEERLRRDLKSKLDAAHESESSAQDHKATGVIFAEKDSNTLGKREERTVEEGAEDKTPGALKLLKSEGNGMYRTEGASIPDKAEIDGFKVASVKQAGTIDGYTARDENEATDDPWRTPNAKQDTKIDKSSLEKLSISLELSTPNLMPIMNETGSGLKTPQTKEESEIADQLIDSMIQTLAREHKKSKDYILRFAMSLPGSQLDFQTLHKALKAADEQANRNFKDVKTETGKDHVPRRKMKGIRE